MSASLPTGLDDAAEATPWPGGHDVSIILMTANDFFGKPVDPELRYPTVIRGLRQH